MTLAAQNGHVELMQFLYDHGCEEDVNHQDERGMVPMMYAAQQDNMEVLEFLYAHGGEKSVTYCRPTDGVSSLGAAIASGKLNIVKWFVEHGASVTSISTMGCTPMIIAAQGNGSTLEDDKEDDGKARSKSYLDIMKYLCEMGAEESLHKPMNDGSTPMHYVAYNGDVETAKWMKEKDVSFVVAASDSRTPMLCATMTGCVEMMDYLYYNGAGSDLNRMYFGGTYSLIHIACANGRLRAVKFLVERCPSNYPFLLDETGSDGFLNACCKGKLSVAEWWYNKFRTDTRFDIHRRNLDDDSALFYAVESGNVALCDFLYNHGCTNVSQPVKHNCMTLLPIACKECHLDVMRWLGDKGAVASTPSFP